MKIFRILDDAIKDNATGHYSHARIIAMLVAFAATIFMWKLIVLGGMSIEYFLGYLAYGTGSVSLNKFLDNRDPTRPQVPVTRVPIEDEGLPRPPKG